MREFVLYKGYINIIIHSFLDETWKGDRKHKKRKNSSPQKKKDRFRLR